MIRTQIYIPRETHNQLAHLSKALNEPMARVVRKFIQEGLERRKGKSLSGKSTLSRIAKLELTGGPKDLSANLDLYLYGTSKKE